MSDERSAEEDTRYEVAEPGAQHAHQERILLKALLPKAKSGRRAVLVAHGMGQQQPFDTMVAVAEGILSEGRRNGLTDRAAKPTAARVQFGTQALSRITLQLAAGEDKTVDVFEAYWAPLTEGRVQLRDVMAFLYDAGINGFFRATRNDKNGKPWFKRWVFGKLRSYPIPTRNRMQLLGALLVIAALAVMNSVIVAVGASRTVSTSVLGGWPSDALLSELSGLFNLELAAASLFVVPWIAAKKLASARLRALSRVFFWLVIVATLLTGVGSAALIALHQFDALAMLRGVFDGPLHCLRTIGGSSCGLHKITWPLFLLASAYVRQLLVQYVGDVAAYVSPNKLDRFDKIRNAIRTRVYDAARAIYGAKAADGTWLYDSIAVVGHSLGSVVSYDCLNRILNDDALSDAPSAEGLSNVDAHTRTSLLLTFGSPLDKIAYVFGSRDEDDVMPGRSALAAASQPLILSEKYNSIPWINVYSPNDIISGALGLYQRPEGDGDPRIQNIVDKDALTWIGAHTEYWKNREVWTHLYRVLIADDATMATNQTSP